MAPPLICLFGPTAVGKTRLLTEVFASFGEVVTVDSVQVYRGLDIGSAKPTAAEQARIPHHLIDILPPDQPFNVGDFCERAEQVCREITARGRVPVLAGGTAYYFKHFLLGLPEAPTAETAVRAATEDLFAREGEGSFRERLRAVDPISVERINPHDHYRLKRAWEVWASSGRPLSSYQLPAVVRSDYRVLVVGLDRERSDLVRRIDDRVDAMMADGLIEEIRGLLAHGYDEASPGLRGIGYSEFLPWLLRGEGQLSDCVTQVKIHSRQYAKRQLTFFKHIPGVEWFHPDAPTDLERRLQAFLAV